MGDHLKVIRREVLTYSGTYRIEDTDIVVETIGNPYSFQIDGLSDREFSKEIVGLKTFEVHPFSENEEQIVLWQVSEGVFKGFNFGYDNASLRNEILLFIESNFNLKGEHFFFVVSSNEEKGATTCRQIVYGEDLFLHNSGENIMNAVSFIRKKRKELFK